jgi:hypothetical protein
MCNNDRVVGGRPFGPSCSLAEDYCLKNILAHKPEQGQDKNIVVCRKT